MRPLFRSRMREIPELCDGRGRVCDGHGRSQALRDASVRRAILHGQRF